VFGNEGAGVIEDAGESGFAVGSRVMFTGPYGVAENGTWHEWLLVRPEHLEVVPDAIDDIVASTRAKLFAEWADQPILVIGTHYAAPTAGHVKRDGAAFRFEV
jgi:hypothetical protein